MQPQLNPGNRSGILVIRLSSLPPSFNLKQERRTSTSAVPIHEIGRDSGLERVRRRDGLPTEASSVQTRYGPKIPAVDQLEGRDFCGQLTPLRFQIT